jgi:hypothetical protein
VGFGLDSNLVARLWPVACLRGRSQPLDSYSGRSDEVSCQQTFDGIGAIHATGGRDGNILQIGFALEQAGRFQTLPPGSALIAHLSEGI